MPADPPINFETLAKQGGNSAAGGYPYQLKAADLQKNFAFATADFKDEHFIVDSATGQGGHAQRKVSLKIPIPAVPANGTKTLTAKDGALSWGDGIPTPPTYGTHVLGAVNGALQWIATEEC